jgi:hypothetical protein
LPESSEHPNQQARPRAIANADVTERIVVFSSTLGGMLARFRRGGAALSL